MILYYFQTPEDSLAPGPLQFSLSAGTATVRLCTTFLCNIQSNRSIFLLDLAVERPVFDKGLPKGALDLQARLHGSALNSIDFALQEVCRTDRFRYKCQ
jgi:hypothetical protein